MVTNSPTPTPPTATTPTSTTPTSTTRMTAAALLKLRGVPDVWHLCVGDHQTYVARMRQFSPFDAEPVVIAPHTRPEPNAIAREAIERAACSCQNGWFYASADVAFGIFQAILPTEVELPLFPPIATAAEEDTEMPAASTEDVTTAAASQEEVEVDPQLWEHVEACSTREATKALEIRTALIARLGKARATELLSRIKATVAKDAQGHQNRVLRANATLLKLKAAGR